VWHKHHFLPLIEKINIDALSWEQIIEHIQSIDDDYGRQLEDFYNKCLEFNQPLSK
jgi:hypothetical protein